MIFTRKSVAVFSTQPGRENTKSGGQTQNMAICPPTRSPQKCLDDDGGDDDFVVLEMRVHFFCVSEMKFSHGRWP